MFAVACGVAVANLYYLQPLLVAIDRGFGVGELAGSLLVTATQLGYAVGLVALVPLGDVLENRALAVRVFALTLLALVAVATSRSFAAFAAASVAVGLTSVVAQILVPFAAGLAPEAERGRAVGRVMSGLLLGILLARTVAGVVAGAFGWRAVFWAAAALAAALTLVLARVLPRTPPEHALPYGALLRSLAGIVRREPVLRRRALYHGAMFATFSAFWTSVTFLLASPAYGLGETGIGLFALVGAAGALAAPFAGTLGDRGHGRAATGFALALGAGAAALTLVRGPLWALALAAVLLDLAVQLTLVLGQHAIYRLEPSERGRRNTIYVATFFLCGAGGSAAAGAAYAAAGWRGVAAILVALPLAALAYWLTEREPDPAAQPGRT